MRLYDSSFDLKTKITVFLELGPRGEAVWGIPLLFTGHYHRMNARRTTPIHGRARRVSKNSLEYLPHHL